MRQHYGINATYASMIGTILRVMCSHSPTPILRDAWSHRSMDRCKLARPIRSGHTSLHRMRNSRSNCSRSLETRLIRRPPFVAVAFPFGHFPKVRSHHCRRIRPIRTTSSPFVQAELRATIQSHRPKTHWNQARLIDTNHEKRRNDVSDAVHPSEASIRLDE